MEPSMNPGERGRLSGADAARVLALGAVLALLAALFHFQGNAVNVPLFGRSVFRWMIARWHDPSGAFMHGWLVPPVSAWLLWRRRRELAACPKRVSLAGLAAVVCFLALHALGVRAMLPRLSLVAFAGLLWAMPFYLMGPRTAGLLFFPCAYLLFCVPLNFLNSFTFPLRLFAAAASVSILNGLGIPCARTGTVMTLGGGAPLSLDVADACSGLRYVLAITALGALYAYLSQTRAWKRWTLFLASVPFAVAGNVVRVLVVGIAARLLGREVAAGLYHDVSGYIVFAVVVALMIGAGAALNAGIRRGEKP